MPKYLQKWSNGKGCYTDWQDFKLADFDDFTDDNGYNDKARLMILNLRKGDRLDLSDGISQFHEIERLI
jgi:hypothetical protein